MPEQCAPNTFAYTIEPGDTLYSLSRRYNTTVSALVSANQDINPDNLVNRSVFPDRKDSHHVRKEIIIK